MSLSANFRHSIGLMLIATGVLGMILTIAMVGLAVPDGNGAVIGCALVGLLVFPYMLFVGIRIRNRAAPESTAFRDEDGKIGWTTRSGTARPSFLEDKKKNPPRQSDDEPNRSRRLDD
jgi:hypothetical protein